MQDVGEVLRKKIFAMLTDPKRVRRSDPGEPEVCPVFALHKIYTDRQQQKEIATSCRNASIGCVDCKKCLFTKINDRQEHFMDKRAKLQVDDVRDILAIGADKARKKAAATIMRIKERLLINV